MTHAEWEAEWRSCFARLRAKGYDPVAAQKKARAITEAKYGKQPAGPPLWLRVALKFAGRKLAGLRPAEEVTMKQRLLVSLLFGLGALVSALQVNGFPQMPEGWLGLAGVFVAAAWGKFSSNQTIVAPDREVWTPEKRAEIVK